MITVVERYPDRILCARKQQTLRHRILAHRVHRASIRQTRDDLLPGLPAVLGAVDVGAQIVNPEAADGGKGSLVIEVRS